MVDYIKKYEGIVEECKVFIQLSLDNLRCYLQKREEFLSAAQFALENEIHLEKSFLKAFKKNETSIKKTKENLNDLHKIQTRYEYRLENLKNLGGKQC